jgi:hypothetical protein
MTKHAHFTFELDAELKDAFLAAAEAENRQASDIVREFIDNYVHSHTEAESYHAFLNSKVIAARKSLAEGKGQSNAEVDAEFAKRRDLVANDGR